MSSNGEMVEFKDNVVVVRQAFEGRGEMRLSTNYLKVLPKKEIVTTESDVVITQAPKTVIHGTGMIYDKSQKTFTLLKRVRVHYERPITKSSKAPLPNPSSSAKVNTARTTNTTVPDNKANNVKKSSNLSRYSNRDLKKN